MSGRITVVEPRCLLKGGEGVRASNAEARLIGVGRAQNRTTSVTAQVLGKMSEAGVIPDDGGRPHGFLNNVTSVFAQVMYSRTPNFEWLDMLIPEVFPYDISFNSIGATRFATDVVIVDSGHDDRNSRWTQPIMEFDIAYGVRTMEHLQGLIAFFRVMRGRLHSFLYHDHTDHTSSQAVALEARKSPPITMMDQPLGVGTGLKKTFQLVKEYASPGGQIFVRPIYKPKTDSVTISQDGGRVTNFTVDHSKGLVTFHSRLVIEGLNDVTMQRLNPNLMLMTCPTNDVFAGLAPGDNIVTTGWLEPANNSTEEQVLTVYEINASRNQIKVTSPTTYGAVEASRDGVTVQVHPAPPTGAVLRCGYEFFVPVRFNTDRIPVSLEAYGVGSAADVKLIEVRPTAE